MVTEVGVFTIGQIDVGASYALSLIDKALKLLDLLLNSPFGALASKDMILSQIQGLLGAGLSLQVAVKNPAAYLNQLLAQLAAMQSMLAGNSLGNSRTSRPRSVAEVGASECNDRSS
jgi:hypothetical protein